MVYYDGYQTRWPNTAPGYSDAEESALSSLHSILGAKYRGRISNSRYPLPLSKWPKIIAFGITAQAVNVLSQTLLHRKELRPGRISLSYPSKWNFLFHYGD
jgi:hypothetical protein